MARMLLNARNCNNPIWQAGYFFSIPVNGCGVLKDACKCFNALAKLVVSGADLLSKLS